MMIADLPPKLLPLNAPEIQALFAAGRPINVWMIGAWKIVQLRLTVPFDTLLNEPVHRPWRLAFGYYDRIRTGEISTWPCFLCQVARPGPNELSCFCIIDSVPVSRSNPAAILPICHTCDGVSPQETLRRVIADFPLAPIVTEGTA